MADGGPAKKIDMNVISRIRSFEIFRSCPEQFLNEFASLAVLRSLPEGELVLQQGYVNDRFLILASGQVEVQIDGEQIALLGTPGDLMGEISAIAARVVSASLIAKTDIEFFEIQARQLIQRSLEAKLSSDITSIDSLRPCSQTKSSTQTTKPVALKAQTVNSPLHFNH